MLNDLFPLKFEAIVIHQPFFNGAHEASFRILHTSG
jgi:hypothetical protein